MPATASSPSSSCSLRRPGWPGSRSPSSRAGSARPARWKVRNAHNLYLETLAELGPVGLGVLVVALGLPLAAAVRARRRALAGAAAGAYVAFVVHASVDWDWQMPAVPVTAPFCRAPLPPATRRP